MSEPIDTLLADLHALLDHVGERGLPLTDTGRLRIADVRAINARFVEPDELDTQMGTHRYHVRREDGARRVHFLRLVAQAASLLDARRGRVRRTPRARALARLAPDDAARSLFVAWWWKGAWDLLPAVAGAPHLVLLRDRAATANALLELGNGMLALEVIGARLRRSLAPRAPASTGFALDDEAWGYAAWHVCLDPLAAFGGSRETRAVEEVNGHAFDRLAAIALTEQGTALLHAALDARPVSAPRVRRGMRTSYALPHAADVDDDALAWMVEGERRERLLREHPEYRDALERGAERVGDVNPRAHLALHEGVEEQIAGNTPPEVRAAYERLLALGYEEHAVRHGIADALARELWAAQREGRAFDNARYAARLAAMPDETDEPEDDDEAALPELPPARLARAKREKLLRLPRSSHTWEGDLTKGPMEVANLGMPVLAIWADAGDGTVRALLPRLGAEPGDVALAAFVDAALQPKAGRPELPARVCVHVEVASALRPALAEIGVGVATADELPFAHDALESLVDFLADPAPRRPRKR